jgi:hypothetical protein
VQESPGENHVCFPVKIFPNQSIDIPKVWIFTNSIIGVSMDSQYERGVFPTIVAFPINPQHSALTTAGSFSTRHLPDYSNNISLVLSLLILQKQEQIIWLVIWNTFFFPYIGTVIIPTDELRFFRGVGQPPTTYFCLNSIQEDNPTPGLGG